MNKVNYETHDLRFCCPYKVQKMKLFECKGLTNYTINDMINIVLQPYW